MQRFAISFDGSALLPTLLGMGPGVSGVYVDEHKIQVRMGRSFRTEIPRSSVREATRYSGRVKSRGVHGGAGRWLVNGSGDGLVQLTMDRPAAGRIWFFKVRVETLIVSLDDPDGFLAAMGTVDTAR